MTSWLHIQKRLRFLAYILVMFAITSAFANAKSTYIQEGEARTFKVTHDIGTVFISNPEVADYELVDNKQLVIFAKKNGRSQLVVYGSDGAAPLITMDIVVDPLLGNISKEIAAEYPGSQVEISQYGKGYVISGTVPNEEARDGIYLTVGEALGLKRKIKELKSAKEGAISDVGKSESNNESIDFMEKISFEGLVNRLKLPMVNQVNVKLSVVEVSKSFMDNVGIDWSNAGLPTGQFSLTKFKFDATTLNNMIYAMKNDAIARVLAEPNLSVMSGETADFLVGGEIPIVTSSNDGVTVTYKEFGVKLTVAAKVENQSKIKLNLSEEISNVDGEYQMGLFNVPKLKTRKARTTVELADGDSFVLAGLLNESDRETLSGIPFISDIPILGALFRNSSTERERTELVVVATVNLVKPISSRDVVYPAFTRSSTAERFFNLGSVSESKSRRQVAGFLDKGGFAQ